jgi:hypothetical protein
MHWGMIGAETVLVIAIIHSDLDGHGSINQTNDGGRNADKVGVSSVRGTCKTIGQRSVIGHHGNTTKEMYGPECLEVIFGRWSDFTRQRL